MSNLTDDHEGQSAEHMAEMHVRKERIEILKQHFNAENRFEEGINLEQRFLGVQQNGHDGDYYMATYPTFEDACDDLGDAVLDGWLPVAVFDLDIAEQIEVQVATPVVTRSEVQGQMTNPLNAEEVAAAKAYEVERSTKLIMAAARLDEASGLLIDGSERIEGILRHHSGSGIGSDRFSINGVAVKTQSIVLKEDG